MLHLDLKGVDPDDGTERHSPMKKGAALPAHHRAGSGPGSVQTPSALLFRPVRLPAMTASLFLADIRKNLIKGDQALEKS